MTLPDAPLRLGLEDEHIQRSSVRRHDNMAAIMVAIGVLAALALFDIVALTYGTDSRDRLHR